VVFEVSTKESSFLLIKTLFSGNLPAMVVTLKYHPTRRKYLVMIYRPHFWIPFVSSETFPLHRMGNFLQETKVLISICRKCWYVKEKPVDNNDFLCENVDNLYLFE